MTATINNYEIELANDLIIIRHKGETVKAQVVKANNALERFNTLVQYLRKNSRKS